MSHEQPFSEADHHLISREDRFKSFSIGLTWSWLGLFALVPLLLMIIISFCRPDEKHLFVLSFTWQSYRELFTITYLRIFLRSFALAGMVTLLTLMIAYPFTYFIVNASTRVKQFLLVLVIVPFWTSSLVRSYAMIALLKTKGLLNTVLLGLGIIHTPIQVLYTNTAVVIGLVYNLLPFMVLPLYANLDQLDRKLVEAARDLGANWFTTFTRVIIPLTASGIISGCIIVLLPAMTLFYIPDVLGGAKSMLLGNLIQQTFLFENNWPQGAAISVVLTLVMVIMMLLYFRQKRTEYL